MPNANATRASESAPAPASAPASRARRAGKAALFALGLTAFAYLLGSARVPCGFARMVHMPCPGCGSTRAMLALASGDLHGLVRYNPLAPFMTAFVVAISLQALASLVTTGTFRRVGDGLVGAVVARGMLVVAALEVVLWLARFGGFLGGPVPV